jgi:arylsulfatase
MRRAFIIQASQAVFGRWAETFKAFPPIQKPNSFTIDDAIEKMQAVGSGD